MFFTSIKFDMAEEDIEAEEEEVLAVSKEKQKEAKVNIDKYSHDLSYKLYELRDIWLFQGVDSVSDYVDEKETSTDVAAVSMALGNFESSMQKKYAIYCLIIWF